MVHSKMFVSCATRAKKLLGGSGSFGFLTKIMIEDAVQKEKKKTKEVKNWA